MASLRPEVQALIDELQGKDGVPPGAVSALQATIESSPYLQNAMAKAIGSGDLKHLGFMSDPTKGGSYDGTDTISLNVSNFNQAKRGPQELKDNLAVVLGHETGHALMADASRRQLYLLEGSVDKALQQSVRNALSDGQQTTDPVDLTPQVSRYLEASRKNEGLAELVGMNALASRISGGDPSKFNRSEFLKRVNPSTPCVDPDTQGNKLVLEQGIVLGKGGVQMTGGKIDGAPVDRVAKCFFDEGVGLGPKGQSSYRDYYGADVMERVAKIWKEHADGTSKTLAPVELDLEKLKLDPQTVSKAGVSLGAQGRDFQFYDISRGGHTLESVEQLYRSPPQKGSRRIAAGNGLDEPQIEASPKLLADNPSHSDFDTFSRIHQWVKGTGQWDEEKSHNVAGALYKEQAADPLVQRVDKVCGGVGRDGAENVFAVYAPFGDKGPFFHAQVDGRQACQQPAQQNLEQAEQIQQQQVIQQQQKQQLQQNNPRQSGPSLSL